MKISIITPCLNSEKTLKFNLNSVLTQDYKNIEHIIVDGLSSDNTIEIISQFPHVSACISEKDEGIYFAMNKGIETNGDNRNFLNNTSV